MKKSKESVSNESISFESHLKSLEAIIQRLEAEESSLEQSLKDFESGIHTAREMQRILETAEQDIRVLLEKNGSFSSETLISEETQE